MTLPPTNPSSQFMALLPIIEVPDAILRATSAPVERVDDELRTLIADMFETMYKAPGIGLAAVQVAVPRRLFVIDLQDPEEEGGEPVRKPHVFINPEILTTSDDVSISMKAASPSPTNMPRSSARRASAPAGSTSRAGAKRGKWTASSPPASSTRPTI